jgi:ABC-2 type transport system permease protein
VDRRAGIPAGHVALRPEAALGRDFRQTDQEAGTMNKTHLVIRQEIINTLTRRSFQLTVFGLPLISFLFFAGLSVLQRESPETVSNILGTGQARHVVGEGYVDQSGLIQALPAYLPKGALEAYVDESAARQALDDGEIEAFYLVPVDYLETGAIIYIRPDFNPISAFTQAFVMQDVLRFNLLSGDSQLAAMVQNPLDLKLTVLEGASERDQDNPLSFFIPYAVTMLYYISILTSASYLLSSI